MRNIHEEESLGKAYDARLMRRLLGYAKPYWHLILLSIFLLLLVTGVQLLRPYLIKVAIDEHINAFNKPYLVFDENNGPSDLGLIYKNQRYVRIDQIDESKYPDVSRKQMLHKKGDYYLINGTIDSDKFSIQENGAGSVTISADNKTVTGELLDKKALQLFRQRDADAVMRLAIIFLIILVLGFGVNYGQVYLLQWIGQKIIYNIREKLFSHLERLSLSFFDSNPVGRLVTRVTNDIQTLNEMYTSVLVNLFKDVFTLIGILLVMFQLNYKLALYSFLTFPLVVISTVIFRIKARAAYRMVRVRLARVNASLAENISGMKIVQIFSQEKKKYQEFDDINQSYYQATRKELMAYAIFRPIMEIISSLGLALIIWFGGRQYMGGALELGVLFAFISYIQQFFRPILELTQKYNIMQSAMASSERIFMLMDETEKIPNPENPKPLGEIKGEIEFKDVWFAYNEEEWVLRDINFSVKPGETVAFVGATGAGKSSIINLLSRFYDVQKGEIQIDGQNIQAVDKYELRRKIGVVLQDVFLYTGDIKSNIRLNNEEISDEEIQKVAHYVNADTFIQKLPQKYDEPVTERGSTLSAGQRQLLAFARTLAFDPDILVLDEATANIDTETEILIQDALEKLIRGRTTLIVAHRLSTIQHADKIIVLHKGKIREMGNHQELLAKGGFYYNLYQLQYKEDFSDPPNNAVGK